MDASSIDIITSGTNTISKTAMLQSVWLNSHSLGEKWAHSPSNFENLNYIIDIITSTHMAADNKYMGLRWANDKRLAFMNILIL